MSAVSIPNGNYYINVRSKVASSVDIPGASGADSTAIQLYSGNGSKAQQFSFTKQSDGSYVIVNVNSGKALDVRNGAAGNNAVVQQYSANGTNAQRWFIRDSGAGYYLQSALGNWVLDLSGGSTANGTAIHLYTPNGTVAQLFTSPLAKWACIRQMRQQRFDQRKTLNWSSTFLVHQLPIARKSSCIQATVPTRKSIVLHR